MTNRTSYSRGIITAIGGLGLAAAVVISGLSVYGWLQGKRIAMLRDELAACELVSTQYRNAMESARKAIEDQNAGISALSKQQYAREKAIEKVLAEGKARQKELEARLRVMKAERQPDPDPCIAACKFLRAPLP